MAPRRSSMSLKGRGTARARDMIWKSEKSGSPRTDSIAELLVASSHEQGKRMEELIIEQIRRHEESIMLLKKLLKVEKKNQPEKRKKFEWAENAWGQPVRVEKR